MSGSKGSSSSESEPWGPTQPYLMDVLGQAQNIYNSPAGREFYPGQTWIPHSPETLSGMQGISNMAQGYNPILSGAVAQFEDATQSGSGAMDYATSVLQGDQSGALNAMAQNTGAQDFYRAAATDNALGNGMAHYARDTYETASNSQNPYMEGMATQAADDIERRIKGLTSGAGRYGSEAQAEMMAGELGDFYTNFYGSQYQADQNRAASMAGLLADIGADNRNRQLTSAQLFDQSLNDQYARELGTNQFEMQGGQLWNDAYGTTQGLANQALGMSSMLNDLMYDPAYRMLEVGGMREGKAQEQLDDSMARWAFMQQAPMANLIDYASLVGGYAGLGGSTAGSSQQASGSGLLGMLLGLG